MRWRWSVAALLGVLALLGTTLPALAQSSQRGVTWRRFDVQLQVQPDGSLVVVETQEIAFNGTFTRGFRVIPTDRTTGITDVSVAEVTGGRTVPYALGSGQPNTYASSVMGNAVRVDWWFPPTTNATRTFQVRYVAHGAIRVYPGGDQLDWQAIYPDRAGPVQAGRVTVRLPGDAPASALKTAFYRTRQGQSAGAVPEAGTGQVTGPGAVQFDVGALPAGTGAEVRVQFPAALVNAAAPPWQAAADRSDFIRQTVQPIARFLSLLVGLMVLAGGAAGLLLLWYSRGRDPGAGKVPPVLDRPPSDLPAPLAGTLVDEVADAQDAVATLVELADRGAVTLVDEVNPQLAGSSRDMRLTLRTPLHDPHLRPHERTLLTGLFGSTAQPGEEVLLSRARPRLAAAIPIIQEQLTRAVAQAGLFERDPAAVRRRYRALGLALVAVGIVAAIAATVLLGWIVPRAWFPGMALAIVGAALVWLARAMPRRTPQGALEAARWRAFRTHLLQVATQPNGHARDPEIQRYLAYAVAFGIDRSFLRRLESVGAPPPAWYGGTVHAPGGIVVLPGGWYGGPWLGGPGGRSGSQPADIGQGGGGQAGGLSAPGVPNPQSWSDALADLLNSASEALAHGGGSGGWSGGGFGGGGGGGGGSGGFN